jgi:hypothetical protein
MRLAAGLLHRRLFMFYGFKDRNFLEMKREKFSKEEKTELYLSFF